MSYPKLKRELPELKTLSRLVVECGECGEELVHSQKEKISFGPLGYSVIGCKIRAHIAKTGHRDVQVDADKRIQTKEIDVEITVNE